MADLLVGKWKLQGGESMDAILKLEGRPWVQRKAADVLSTAQECTLEGPHLTIISTTGPTTNVTNAILAGEGQSKAVVEGVEVFAKVFATIEKTQAHFPHETDVVEQFLNVRFEFPNGAVRVVSHILCKSDPNKKIVFMAHTHKGQTATCRRLFVRV